MKGSGFIYVIGFLAQAFFSARIIFQWILSERAKKVVSPSIFWILSIAGSYLLTFCMVMISDVCSAVAVFSVSAGICSFANGFRICAASMCAPFCVWLAWLILKLSFSFLNIVKLALV